MHWLATATFLWSMVTGLRLLVTNRWAPTTAPSWITFLPQGEIFSWHVMGAWAWGAVLFTWWIYRHDRRATRRRTYLSQNPLSDRLSHSRLSKQSSKRSRKQALSKNLNQYNRLVILCGYWVLSALLGSGIVLWTGWLDHWRDWLLQFHLLLAALSFLLVTLHAVGQWLAISTTRMLKLFLTLPVGRRIPRYWIVVSVGIVLVVCFAFNPLRILVLNELVVLELDPVFTIEMDGVLGDAAWQSTTAVTVMTRVPGGSESIPIEVRAVRQGLVIYFAFSWPDTTQSLHHLPLIKTAQGWKVMHDGFERHDERTWYEDKFAVAFAASPTLAGGGSIVLGSLGADRKGSDTIAQDPNGQTDTSIASVRGTHVASRGIVDLWHWKAVRNQGTGILDDSHFSKAYPRIDGSLRDAGGYFADPSYAASITYNWQWFRQDVVTPKRLPRDPERLVALQDAFHQNRTGAFQLAWHDTEPYDPRRDHYPPNTVMPSVLWIGSSDYDRADVAAVGHWHEGRWTVEAKRGLDADSEFDLDIHDGIFLWVAAFDHAQTLHSYHLRPLQLRFR